jgi:hypothetical protein
MFLILLVTASAALASDYDMLRERALTQCATIGEDEERTGLLFNPDGYRSFFVRSQCLQDAAVKFRDRSLCSEVRRRWSLFSSSWGVSSSHCRELVDEGVAADQAEIRSLKAQYQSAQIVLADFRVERNGNGRDFDIVPSFAGRGGHAYMLSFRLNGSAPIHRSGYFLNGDNNIRIFVQASDIAAIVPGFSMDALYDVTAELEFSIGQGSQSGRWSDAFIAQSFPSAERTQTLVRQVRFGDTTFTPYVIR